MKNDAPFVVAIDGPAGAGKSTTAKKLAARLGYAFLDTGAIYRTVALSARRNGIAWSDGPRLAALAARLDIVFVASDDTNRVLLEGVDVTTEIRTAEISDGASRVSALPEVRASLLDLQRRLGERARVVAEGRDVGTVIFPRAGAKFFLTASPEERARRRAKELAGAGRQMDLQTVMSEMRERDERDSTRSVAPLKKAEDAIQIDSGGLTADEVVRVMADLVSQRGG
jgi:cytidylate kinase